MGFYTTLDRDKTLTSRRPRGKKFHRSEVNLVLPSIASLTIPAPLLILHRLWLTGDKIWSPDLDRGR